MINDSVVNWTLVGIIVVGISVVGIIVVGICVVSRELVITLDVGTVVFSPPHTPHMFGQLLTVSSIVQLPGPNNGQNDASRGQPVVTNGTVVGTVVFSPPHTPHMFGQLLTVSSIVQLPGPNNGQNDASRGQPVVTNGTVVGFGLVKSTVVTWTFVGDNVDNWDEHIPHLIGQ
jgi:hypothetical protein